jgi:diacylglycerol kinase family enzyme
MLYNAKAGAQKGKDIQQQTQVMLQVAGISVLPIPLERKNHATEICAVS